MNKLILVLILFTLFAGGGITVIAQEPEERYVPETDPLVLVKLEKWQEQKVKMIGTETSLKWNKTNMGFVINIPEKIRKSPPAKFVWVMEVTF
jgi:alpha-L-fucosidase